MFCTIFLYLLRKYHTQNPIANMIRPTNNSNVLGTASDKIHNDLNFVG